MTSLMAFSPRVDAQYGEQAQLYGVSTSDVLGASVRQAFEGVGSYQADIAANKVAGAGGREITPEEYKSSEFYRQEYPWYFGLTEDKAKALAEYGDKTKPDKEILSKASGWQTAGGFAAGMSAGIVEPKNLAIGLATFGVGGVLASSARTGHRLKTVLNARKASSGYAARAQLGALEGMVATAVAEPSNRYSANILQEDYTMYDTMFNLATSIVLGAGLEVAPKFVADRFRSIQDKSKAVDITLQELDTAVDQLALGKRIEVDAVERAAVGDIATKPMAEKMAAVERSVRYTDTPEFKARFEGSKVVDAEGKPLMVYHGTNRVFSSFSTVGEGKSKGAGAFFSNDPQIASTYAPRDGANIRPSFLKMNKPFIVEMAGQNWSKIDGKTTVLIDGNPSRLDSHINEFSVSSDKLSRWAKENGYDGVVFRGASDRGPNYSESGITQLSDVYNVFDEKQVISALGADDADAIARRLDAESAEIAKKHLINQARDSHDTAIDEAAIARLEDYEEQLMVQKHIDELEKTNAYVDELNKMEAEGIISTKELDDFMDAMESVDVDKLQSAWEAARICLTRG